MKSSIYAFSGLGADKRAFAGIDFSGHHITFIEWIPNKKNESIESYAKRLSEQILDPNPVLIGVSFGGMIAIEVARIISVEKIIIISSAKGKNELPLIYRIAGSMQFHKLLPYHLMNKPTLLLFWFFSVRKVADKILLSSIIRETDVSFLKWAINAIVNWKRKSDTKDVYHIHGQKDRILPLRNVYANVIIPKGGHFMLVTESEVISKKINQQLALLSH